MEEGLDGGGEGEGGGPANQQSIKFYTFNH